MQRATQTGEDKAGDGRPASDGDDRLAIQQWARRAGISATELDVLRALSFGASNKEIGAKLGITSATVRSHVLHLCRKLDVSSRGELAWCLADQVERTLRARGRALVRRLGESKKERARLETNARFLESVLCQLGIQIVFPPGSNRSPLPRDEKAFARPPRAPRRSVPIRDLGGHVIAFAMIPTEGG
jgi:DNA-binding CsgD family transcriptional regulator